MMKMAKEEVEEEKVVMMFWSNSVMVETHRDGGDTCTVLGRSHVTGMPHFRPFPLQSIASPFPALFLPHCPAYIYPYATPTTELPNA